MNESVINYVQSLYIVYMPFYYHLFQLKNEENEILQKHLCNLSLFIY